ncbi:MAG: helix-turn-helix domain-containing protein [bacterium]
MLSKSLNTHSEIRLKAVKEYLASASLKKVATSFNIHPRTLKRWLRWYKDGGEKNLKRQRRYRRHFNRFDPSIEKRIVLLKERKPSITISNAKKILDRKGVIVSRKGIWGVWKRYNLVGFQRDVSQLGADVKISPECKDGSKKAEKALNSGNLKKAAHILNALPPCDNQDILRKIPNRFLSLSRKIEKLDIAFDKIPFPEAMRKAKILRKRAKNKNLFYTSIRAGLIELRAMTRLGNPKKQLILVKKLLNRLKKKDKPVNAEPSLHFHLLFSKGNALADIGRTRQVLLCLKKCETLGRRLKEARHYGNIAALYSTIGFHKKAYYWIKKSLKCTENKYRGILYEYLAGNLVMAGEYAAVRKVLKGIKIDKPGFLPLAAIINAMCCLGEGKILDATHYANQALLTSRKEGILGYLISSFSILAACSCGINERNRAISQLKRLMYLVDKFGMKNAFFFIKVLLGHSSLPRDAILMPDIRLALLLHGASKSLKITDYRKAYNYATSQRLIGLLHRMILFFPEPVNELIARGKPTGLPKGLLRLPIFQKNIPVYYLKFLGPVRFFRNGVKLRRDPAPMSASFFIYFSFKRKIGLNSIYNNFWRRAKNPRASLSHFLYGLRKYLRLPPNTIFIREGFLHFKGYITTDYQEFEQTLVQAKALERAGEWAFARKEYLRAFKLFRGEPFKKMYDNWSENMRRVILNKLETEAIHFAESCLEHNNRKDAHKVLKMVSKIIPNSDEVRKMLSEYGRNGVSGNGNDL